MGLPRSIGYAIKTHPYQIPDDKLILAAGKTVTKETDWQIKRAIKMVDPYTAIDHDHVRGSGDSVALSSQRNFPPNSNNLA